jgi:transcriptional regulator with XRE-family HTH domain
MANATQVRITNQVVSKRNYTEIIAIESETLYSHLGSMAFRDDRLREILEAKGLSEPADVHHRTGIPYAQLGRYLRPRGTKGSGLPSVDTLATIVTTLELDADYLLDTDTLYEMPPFRAAAHMALERYLSKRRCEGAPVSDDEAATLRHLADQMEKPPVWVADWAAQHESVVLSAGLHAQPSSVGSGQVRRRRIRNLPS